MKGTWPHKIPITLKQSACMKKYCECDKIMVDTVVDLMNKGTTCPTEDSQCDARGRHEILLVFIYIQYINDIQAVLTILQEQKFTVNSFPKIS